ncbi:probable G-protein coupled receptor Mth-like 1 [Trichogramma pretiosum]|uniref:probable G-protein coupled receptor Mth-like 1 n=1 Tax=Trichogramma pretiosum TaxID=7493 RepID=UPI0006C98E53|nr:probable G-protein coupled receptor Mth-like 1 [Trichogramma pretiosum]
MAWTTILLLVLAQLLASCGRAVEVNDSDAASDKPLEIRRCCRLQEDLEDPGKLADGLPRCVPSPEPFNPEVYSPEIGNFLPQPPISWRFLENTRPVCRPTQQLRFIPRNKFNPFVLLSSGNVYVEVGSETSLAPDEYCLGSRTLLACMPRKNESLQAAATMRPKIRKCCGENAIYDVERQSCFHDGKTSIITEQTLLVGSNENNRKMAAIVEMVGGFPTKCPNDYTLIDELYASELQADGSLQVKHKLVPAEEFCIESVQAVDSEHLLPVKVFACSEHAAERMGVAVRDIRFTLYPVGFIISAVFLAATLASGWLLPSSHHLLHWRCQTYHVTCLMLGDITMAIIQLGGTSLQGEFCRALAIMAHFFFLATFFWLNTMCFNIWWTFRDLRPASLEKGQEMLRLKFYGAYAWGGPLVVAGLAAVLDHLPISPEYNFLRPGFGEKQCWFYGNAEILAYFFGPIGLLLLINLLFFAATARELTCGLWKGEIVKSTTERAALGKVCLKLVIVMGVPWIFDVISWMAGGPEALWYVTDLCNAAQGVLIFVVVGCQPQVRATAKRWFRNPRTNTNLQGNGHSTTSHGMPSIGDSITQNPSTKAVPLETIC